MKGIKSRIVALFLVLAMVIVVIPQVNIVNGGSNVLQIVATEVEESNNEKISVSYKFANNNPGYAYGSITITTEELGVYDLYWGDSNGNKLAYNGVSYSELGTCEVTGSKIGETATGTYNVISPYTAIPEGAEQLLVYNGDSLKASYSIPDDKLFNEGKAQYRFGVVSDVHYNRYNDYSDDDSISAFNTALKFIDNQGIDFVGVAGDLSQNSETDSFKKFKSAIDKYPNITVYSCMGNHDVNNIWDFRKYVNKKKNKDKNVKNISENEVDFVYEKNGDIFIFFSQTRWDYYTDKSYLVTKDQLNWLEKNLNTYAEKNVYLFFHTYFASEDGNITTAVGNLINPGGYTYDLTYRFGNADEKRFRKLLNKYPNVTVFSGHSHWAYDQQKYNANLNIGNIKKNNTGATLVHISSIGAPRTIEENASAREENNGIKSEGTVATKYKNSTVYTGVDFKNGKYLAYATYINEDGKKSTPVPAIKLKKTKITSIGKVKKVSKKSKKYKVKIKYKKIANTVGYQIQYSTNKKFKNAKTKKAQKTNYTITKLKRQTKYYVRVRAYSKQFGYRVYGKWSNKKIVRTKK